MNVLFYGADGWIGGMIYQEWQRAFPQDTVIKGTVRVNPSSVREVEEELLEHNVDIVVSTVGRTSGTLPDGRYIPNIDYLETNLYQNVRDNLFAPMILAQLCAKHKIHLTYLGTGCIFSEDTRQPTKVYTEQDVPDFFGSSYSVVKGFTDTLMKEYTNVLNVRIRMPITDDWNSKNFIAKIVAFEKIYSMPNSMTYLPDIIPSIVRLSRDQVQGTVNFVNGSISHGEILELYREIVDPSHTFESIDEDQLQTLLVAKRSNNILDNSKLQGLYEIKPMKECIVEALQHMKETK